MTNMSLGPRVSRNRTNKQRQKKKLKDKKREIYKDWNNFDHKLRAFASTSNPWNRGFYSTLLKIVGESDSSSEPMQTVNADSEKAAFSLSSYGGLIKLNEAYQVPADPQQLRKALSAGENASMVVLQNLSEQKQQRQISGNEPNKNRLEYTSIPPGMSATHSLISSNNDQIGEVQTLKAYSYGGEQDVDSE